MQLGSQRSVLLVVVDFAVKVKFDLALVLQLRLLLLLVLQQMWVYPKILFKFPFIYLVEVQLNRVILNLLPQLQVAVYNFILILLDQQPHKKPPQALSHRKNNRPGENFQLVSVLDLLHVQVQNLVVYQKIFNVAKSIQPTIMGIGLSRHHELISLYLLQWNLLFSSFFKLKFQIPTSTHQYLLMASEKIIFFSNIESRYKILQREGSVRRELGYTMMIQSQCLYALIGMTR